MMLCLFGHKWVILWERSYGNIACYRRCERCRSLERGVLDFSSIVSWEKVRADTHSRALQMRLVRLPLPRLDRWAHSLGLSRTRASDRARSVARST